MFLSQKNKEVLKDLCVDYFWVAIFCFVVFFLLGCSSVPKVYPCPNGHSVSLEKIKKDIRAINTCPICGAEFPYLATEEKRSGGYSFGYRPCYPGYRVWVYGYRPCYPRYRVWVYGYRTTRFHSYHHGH